MHRELFNFSLPSSWVSVLGVNQITIYSYAVCIVIGSLIATRYTIKAAKKELNINLPYTFFYLLFLGGFVGGKIFYYLEKPSMYWNNPNLLLDNFSGGFVFYGSFITIMIILWFYFRKYKMAVLAMLDILAMTTLLVHAFGRLGCFFGGCCYGKPTDSITGIIFPTSNNYSVHPTQLYEVVVLMSILFILLFIKPYKKFNGQLFLSYVILYASCRIILELFRGDERGFIIENYISHSQFISLLLLLITILYYKKLDKNKIDLKLNY
ncbi:MAG: prolipoprotein diacylglyceryl transferase [Flavobacteriaceae bacterium]|nr:MAG: prolipoprotein diacylglyceryl transferase [Flavobacteriaceae bacterium]